MAQRTMCGVEDSTGDMTLPLSALGQPEEQQPIPAGAGRGTCHSDIDSEPPKLSFWYGLTSTRLSLYENRITKLVGPVAHSVKFLLGSAQCCVGRECLQQLVMTCTGLMNSGKDHIDNAEAACRADELRRQPISGMHMAVSARSVFQCAYDRRADRENAPAMRPRALDS